MFDLGASVLGGGAEELGGGLLGGLTGLAGGLLGSGLFGGLGGGSTSSNSNSNFNQNVSGGGLGGGIRFSPIDINNYQKAGGGFSLFGGGGGGRNTNQNSNTNVNQNAAQANNALTIETPFSFPSMQGMTAPPSFLQGGVAQQSQGGLYEPRVQPVGGGTNPALAALSMQRMGGGAMPVPMGGFPQGGQGQPPPQMQPGFSDLQAAISQALQRQDQNAPQGQAAPYMPQQQQPQGGAAPSAAVNQDSNPDLTQMQMHGSDNPMQVGRVAGGNQYEGRLKPPPPPETPSQLAAVLPSFTPQLPPAPPPDPGDPDSLKNDNKAQAALIGPEADKILKGSAEKIESLRERLDEEYTPLVREAKTAKRLADSQAAHIRQQILADTSPAQQNANWNKAANEAYNEIAPPGSPEAQLLSWYRQEVNKPGWMNAVQQLPPRRTPAQELGRRLLIASGRMPQQARETAAQQAQREQQMEQYKAAIAHGVELSNAIQKRANELNTKDYDKEMTLKERVAKDAVADAEKGLKDLRTQYESSFKNGQLEAHRQARQELQALKDKLEAGKFANTVRHQGVTERQQATNSAETKRSHLANEGLHGRTVGVAEKREGRIAAHQQETTPIWKQMAQGKIEEAKAKTEELQAMTNKIKAGTNKGGPPVATSAPSEAHAKALARAKELYAQGLRGEAITKKLRDEQLAK